MRDYLIWHFEKYPRMELQDIVKLIYQSEFGGGHIIKSPEDSLKRLTDEFQSEGWRMLGQGKKTGIQDFVEPVGDGMCRIGLGILEHGLSQQTLNRMFVLSAEKNKGTIAGFEKGLEVLIELCKENKLPYSLDQVETYLQEYKAAGYPAVSHSQVYRDAYHPSYRIVDSRFGRYIGVFAAIDRVLGLSAKGSDTTDKPVKVAVDGMSGSGKSTLARLMADIYDCNVFHMDDFFLQPWQRTRERLEQAGGNVDYERFKAEILDRIGYGKTIKYQIYDCSKQMLDRKVEVQDRRLNLIEGSYSHHPYFGDCYDIKVFLEVDGETQRKRILERNGEFMLERFLSQWIPMEHKYFKEFRIRERSSFVFGEEGRIRD